MDNKKEIWVTTVDNPFDPFSQWDMWLWYDKRMGYNTCERLAKIMQPSNNLTEFEFDSAFLAAIFTLLDFYSDEVYTLAIEGKTKRFGNYN